MSLITTRAAIKAVLSSITGIGEVHDYERFSNDWTKFLELFKDDAQKINGVAFARSQFSTQQRTLGETEVAHVFVLRRIMGLNDALASGVTFDDHLETMRLALRQAATLNSADVTTAPDWGPMAGAVGAQMDISEIRMFGGVLCHYAELRLCVAEDEI